MKIVAGPEPSVSLEPEWFNVQEKDREPLVAFMVNALQAAGCRIIYRQRAKTAPFKITFETPEGERIGILAYAFYANKYKNTPGKDVRPPDEYRFQLKYGSSDRLEHELWQDPFGLYTTLLLGINHEQGYFVAADPMLHSPTKMFISVEFKQRHVDAILDRHWHTWEREQIRPQYEKKPVEVLVGGTSNSFLRYVQFEREAAGEDQGHRQLLAERVTPVMRPQGGIYIPPLVPGPERLHALAAEFEMGEDEVLSLIEGTPRLKMAVRGWVAEVHLSRYLQNLPGVEKCERLVLEGTPDIMLIYEGSRPLYIECKNVLRKRDKDGRARVDFQRTRASKTDPCSRYYSPDDFDVLAACLHAVSEKWEYQFVDPRLLDPHKTCSGKLSNKVLLDSRWDCPVADVLRAAACAK